MSQAKNWVFTLNNYVALCDFDEVSDLISYAIYQEEVGETGTPHLQGYLQCSRRVRLGQLQAIPSLAGAHFEVAKGSPEQNRAYCTKPEGRLGGPYEFGQPAQGQGARSDLLALKRVIDEGSTVDALYEASFSNMIRYGRALLSYKRFRTAPRNFETLCFFFCGLSGWGKSRTVLTLAQMLGSVYHVPSSKGSGLYWDDYDGETSVIIDEMDGSRCNPTFLNSLMDRYPFIVPVHGGAGHQFVSRYIFIISNYHPSYWWPKSRPNLDPFFRRLIFTFKFVRHALARAQQLAPIFSRAPNSAGVSSSRLLFL